MACCLQIAQNEQLVATTFTDKRLFDGPNPCFCYPIWWSTDKFYIRDLKLNEFALATCAFEPTKNRYVFGPTQLRLEGPYEVFGPVQASPMLSGDDYLVVIDREGIKRNVIGPTVFKPVYGEKWDNSKKAVSVPMNCYAIVDDSNDPLNPVKHIRGPTKFFPQPFQSIRKTQNNSEFFPCIEVTTTRAMHLQRVDGSVVLLDVPNFYMPQVGEKILKIVDRNVLIKTDFCILKSQDGTISVMNGQFDEQRSFFLKPFQEFVTFQLESQVSILSTLLNFIPHKFAIRTSDNVVLDLDVRLSYQIQDVNVFSLNPIDFYGYIKNHVQNELLHRFSATTLREFMSTFIKIAQQAIQNCSEYFSKFGIAILDVQILNYLCTNTKTQELLEKDIHTNVNKQNELRARQNDILIQEQGNEVQRRQKDLEVQMAQKDNEVALQKKILENDIRIKEMEIEIAEEKKRLELLAVKRGNDLVEAEFLGRSKGHEFREFVLGIGSNVSAEDKVKIWKRQCDLEQSKLLYKKVNEIVMYPPNADLKLFQFEEQANLPPPAPSSSFTSSSASSKKK